jgi:hypothetical protein
MNTVFANSAREYDDWFVRNESAYRSELAAAKAFLPLSLADPFRALREASRVLKPRGRLIVGMIDPDSPLGRA